MQRYLGGSIITGHGLRVRQPNGVHIKYWQRVMDDGKGTADPGWYCWAFVNGNIDFEGWMKQHCPTANYEFRFNSGDPMYTINITNEKEALLFNLQWVK